MKIPAEVKPASWGAVGGAIAVAIVGFTWGGWVTSSTAKHNAEERAEAAVVKALAPICADRFRQQADLAMHLDELKKVDAWKRGTFVSEGGWATMPGKDTPEFGVAKACAELLSSQT